MQGLSWPEVAAHLGTSPEAARSAHRRSLARGMAAAVSPDALTHHARGAHGRDGGVFVSTAVPSSSDGQDRRSDSVGLRSEIDLARAHIARVTRAEIRLRHSLLADREINDTLAQRLRDFDAAIQSGVIPSLALRLVEGEE